MISWVEVLVVVELELELFVVGFGLGEFLCRVDGFLFLPFPSLSLLQDSSLQYLLLIAR